jgi:uncharacterized surface protein with fasciclin (FAS1) repeats
MKATKVLSMMTALFLLAVVHVADGFAKKKDIVDTAVEAGQFTTLATALTEAGLVDVLKGRGPFTVFAPTDAAFAELPAGTIEALLKPENSDRLNAILTYHVVAGRVTAGEVAGINAAETVNGQRINVKTVGGKVLIDGATVISADVEASNGVIHVIDRVLLPEEKDIVGVADEAGDFKTLLAAAQAAGLAGALSGDGPFTVFAPTDEAFAALPKGTVESLLEKENLGQLAEILKYHVIKGRMFSDAVLKSGNFITLQGGKLEASVKGGGAFVNKAAILGTDIDASNGVIHVIDAVLIPPDGHASASSGCSN